MIFREEHKDLFSVNFKEWTPAHCISLDCKMGAGIAVPMKKKFKLGGLSKAVEELNWTNAKCIYHNGVYNLITKKKYWNKPTYRSMANALVCMRIHADNNNIKKIVMPKIGCGLDRLNWPKVRELIKKIFENSDIEILVCHK